MKKIKYGTIISNFYIFLIFMVSSVHAMPVKIVYRADSRPPHMIFEKGFVAWGTNINFNAHIDGTSGRRGSRDSAFIPTTSRLDAAMNFATDLLNVSPDNISYIYQIRATHNFYSALDSIYYVYDAAHVRVPDTHRALLAEEQEYSAYINIPPELIESVTVQERINGEIITTVIPNHNYIAGDTHSSEEPFTYWRPERIDSRPMLYMGPSMTNINNEQPEGAAALPSPSFNAGGVLGISLFLHNEL
ncbi:scabin-related ADP-ribosyltransferase [Vibrio anguillarum]|uniref:scabin-related ADP-ribosyltransferase n=1 Tax=Vibrio anguillarum TaxID=55601 RepID=UPI00031B6354|nr:enterotoxin A family protein [Vibrio anguillarum]OEE35445.1 hypothetical protein A1QW_07790 [Vibrio anguillarum]OEF92169.1 hypothetical protein A1QY_15435 [Vibrio anguillarum]